MTTINLLILRQVMIADEVVGPHRPPHKGRVAHPFAHFVSSPMTSFTKCPGTSFTLPRKLIAPGHNASPQCIVVCRDIGEMSEQ